MINNNNNLVCVHAYLQHVTTNTICVTHSLGVHCSRPPQYCKELLASQADMTPGTGGGGKRFVQPQLHSLRKGLAVLI